MDTYQFNQSVEAKLNEENILLKRELEKYKKHDCVTGLVKRRYFQEVIGGFNHPMYFPMGIVMMDINGLKRINDSLGISEVDQLLSDFGRKVLGKLSKFQRAVRWDGGQFMFILARSSEQATAQFCKEMKSLFKESDTQLTSISFGYSVWEKGDIPLTAVVNSAENLMYKNKLLEVKSSRSSIINTMQYILSEKSAETEAHAMRLFYLSKKIGRFLNIKNSLFPNLELLCRLHDIGKITISRNILHKRDGLTDEEWRIMRSHAEAGYRILNSVPELVDIAPLVLHHHERWDGKGYPWRIAGEEIPLLSRILSVVDAFDAMTNDRVYRKAVEETVAIDEIKRNSGSQFDPKVVSAFIEILSKEKNKVYGIEGGN